MAVSSHSRPPAPAWECRECWWLLTAAQVDTLRSLGAPCPDCGRGLASFRSVGPARPADA